MRMGNYCCEFCNWRETTNVLLFCTAFCRFGFVVITYDYRGVALSKPDQLKGFKASMRTWGNTDYKAVTDFIEEHYPNHRKFLIGHSVGALILGMNKGSEILKILFRTTQKYLFWTSFSKN